MAKLGLYWLGAPRVEVEERAVRLETRKAAAEVLCREILARFGADPAEIFTGTFNAGHPGGMVPLSAAEAESLHPSMLPNNMYVADSSLFPRSPGSPPILTILALARRVARAAIDSYTDAASAAGEAATDLSPRRSNRASIGERGGRSSWR